MLYHDSSVANSFEDQPALSEKVMLDTELHSIVTYDHALVYHLVNKVCHHHPNV